MADAPPATAPAPAPAAQGGVTLPGNLHDAKDGPIIKIRLFEPQDLKEVRLLLGYGVMEQLAIANTLLYTNLYVIALWLALSSMMIQLLSWWPSPSGPAWTWLLPLPALASCAVPILFIIDWLNRAYFEHLVRHVLAREDMMHVREYYGKVEGSAFWVLVYKGNPIGCVATDTYKPASELKGLDELKAEREAREKLEKEQKEGEGVQTRSRSKAKKKKEQRAEKQEEEKDEEEKLEPGQVVYVRHFHLDSPYRPTYIQNDLFAHALNHAFTSAPTVQKAYLRVSRLTPWLQEVSRTMGMERCDGPPGAIDLNKEGLWRGLQRHREWWVGVDRETWEKRYEEMRELHGL